MVHKLNRSQLQAVLKTFDQYGMFVITTKDLRCWFSYEPEKTFKSALSRHVKEGILEHPCRGIYINPYAKSRDSYVLEHIAKALRKGEYNYISLESLLSEIGLISQVPINLLTVMTTGRSQYYKTPYGNIEFTHTNKSIANILKLTYVEQDRPLRVAMEDTAIRDLKKVNRNTHLIESNGDDYD
jgi:predicted transcriptional regulator of viral defense system